jgi:hypothetical protein
VYYPDLTEYTYYQHIQGLEKEIGNRTALNVGWLETGNAYPTGTVSEEILDTIFLLCSQPVNEARGIHVCDLCVDYEVNYVRTQKDGQEVVYEIPARNKAERHGKTILLGTGEIHVPHGDSVYVAPVLIYHYMTVHHYLPPACFIEAVQQFAKKASA